MTKRMLCALLCLLLLLPATPAMRAAESVEVQLADEALYAALCEALAGRASFTADAEVLTLAFAPGELEKVDTLTLRNSRIADIAGLERFTSLCFLDLSNNSIEDFSPLRGLTSLETLRCSGNLGTELGWVGGLTSLRELDLSKNRLFDGGGAALTRALGGLTALRTLDLSGNLLTSIDGLDCLTELTRLDLYDNAVHDFAPLAPLTRLRALFIGENDERGAGLTGLEALRGLAELRVFECGENARPDILTFVGELPLLEEVYVERSGISDLSPLAGCASLRVLSAPVNRIGDITPLLGLKNLETIDLYADPIASLSGILNEDGAPVWPRLKSINIGENWRIRPCAETEALLALADGGLALAADLERLIDVSSLPHTDENGVAYVSYDDFRPCCDGVRDDFSAVAAAHRFANSVGCAVRAGAGQTYHLFKRSEYSCLIRTDTDWQGARFIVHDEDIEQIYARQVNLFTVETAPMNESVVLTDLDWTVGTDTTQLPQLREALQSWIDAGVGTFFCTAENSDKRQYIRFGSDGDDGQTQVDFFRVGADGAVLDDIQWDFDHLTKLTARPMPSGAMSVKNGVFITTAFNSRGEVPYSRGVKPIYYSRGIRFQRCAHLEVSNLRHTLEPDVLSGSYIGFFVFSECADVDLRDSYVFARLTNVHQRSTYDLLIERTVDMRLTRLDTNDVTGLTRWGVTGTNYTKYITYEDCRLNRIDAHKGVYDLTVRGCEIGQFSLTGRGTLDIRNTTVWRNNFFTLRGDYGATWDGQVNIIDCTARYWDRWAPVLVTFSVCRDEDGSLHDFGYPLHLPDIYVENLTIDSRYDTPLHPVYTLLPNWNIVDPDEVPQSYWPRNVIVNGVSCVNNEHMGAQRMQTVGSPQELGTNFVVTDLALRCGESDLTRALIAGERPTCREAVTLRLAENRSTRNELEVLRGGETIIARQAVSGVLETVFDRSGSYEVRLWSIDTYRGKDGALTLRFDLDLSREATLAPGVTCVTDRRADGLAVRIMREESASGLRVLAAVYDGEGRMLSVRELPDGETVLAAPDGSGVRVFCIDAAHRPAGLWAIEN